MFAQVISTQGILENEGGKGLFRRTIFFRLGHIMHDKSPLKHIIFTQKKIESGLASGSVHRGGSTRRRMWLPLVRIPNNHQRDFRRIYGSALFPDLSPVPFPVQFTKIDRRLMSSFKSLFCLHLSRDFAPTTDTHYSSIRIDMARWYWRE